MASKDQQQDDVMQARAKMARKAEKGEMCSELPPELLESILDRLPLRDFFSFRIVCKGWMLASSRRSSIIHFSRTRPWLLIYGMEDMCYLYSDSHPECCILWLPHLRGATCVYSQFGWLLVHRKGHLFFYNPFTREQIDLPKYLHVDSTDQVYMFASVPTSADCSASIIRRISPQLLEFYTCHVGDREWNMRRVNTSREFAPLQFATYCNCCRGSRCNCVFKDIIFFYDSDKCHYLNLEKKCYSSIERKKKSFSEEEYYSFSGSLKAAWLQKFARKGICFSVCPLSMLFEDGTNGLQNFRHELKVDGIVTTEVKAAWVEPVFADKLGSCPELMASV